MYSFRSLSEREFRDIIASKPDLNYTSQGLTESFDNPQGYHTNQYTHILGTGEELFKNAREHIRAFRHLDLNWTGYHTSEDHLGENVYITNQAKLLILWGIAISKVTKVIDEPTRYGYVMGTTTHHIVMGEEIFLLEMKDNKVTFTIYSYSKPQGIMSYMGQIIIRRFQRKFVRTVSTHLYELVHPE